MDKRGDRVSVQQRKIGHTGGSLFYLGALIYVSLLILFAYQTGAFVTWLFPSDQILFRILTVVCFDGLSLFWALVDLFYRYATRVTRDLVRWAWGISFLLSLIASVLYLIIESMFRMTIAINATWLDVGYGVVITAIVFQIIMLTFFFYIEWIIRHPRQYEFIEWTQEEANQITTKIGVAPVVVTTQQTDSIAQANDQLLAETLLIQEAKEKKKRRRSLVTETDQGANTITQPSIGSGNPT